MLCSFNGKADARLVIPTRLAGGVEQGVCVLYRGRALYQLANKKPGNVRLCRRQVVDPAHFRFDIGGFLARRGKNDIDGQADQNRNANGENP